MNTQLLTKFDDHIIPISRLNKGEASQICKELKQDGIKVVLKNNKREAIIMSPEYYDNLMESFEDQRLAVLAERRTLMNEPEYISLEKSMLNNGITQEMLDEIEDEELEFD